MTLGDEKLLPGFDGKKTLFAYHSSSDHLVTHDVCTFEQNRGHNEKNSPNRIKRSAMNAWYAN